MSRWVMKSRTVWDQGWWGMSNSFISWVRWKKLLDSAHTAHDLTYCITSELVEIQLEFVTKCVLVYLDVLSWVLYGPFEWGDLSWLKVETSYLRENEGCRCVLLYPHYILDVFPMNRYQEDILGQAPWNRSLTWEHRSALWWTLNLVKKRNNVLSVLYS